MAIYGKTQDIVQHNYFLNESYSSATSYKYTSNTVPYDYASSLVEAVYNPPPKTPGVKVEETFVVVNEANGSILKQFESESKALKFARQKAQEDISVLVYKAYKRFGPKAEIVEEDV